MLETNVSHTPRTHHALVIVHGPFSAAGAWPLPRRRVPGAGQGRPHGGVCQHLLQLGIPALDLFIHPLHKAATADCLVSPSDGMQQVMNMNSCACDHAGLHLLSNSCMQVSMLSVLCCSRGHLPRPSASTLCPGGISGWALALLGRTSQEASLNALGYKWSWVLLNHPLHTSQQSARWQQALQELLQT